MAILRTPLRDCLRAAVHVARCRQMNYLQAVDANDKKFGSIEQTRAPLFTNVLLGPF
jgi:hypothetical protein